MIKKIMFSLLALAAVVACGSETPPPVRGTIPFDPSVRNEEPEKKKNAKRFDFDRGNMKTVYRNWETVGVWLERTRHQDKWAKDPNRLGINDWYNEMWDHLKLRNRPKLRDLSDLAYRGY